MKRKSGIPLTTTLVLLVTGIVLSIVIFSAVIFMGIYQDALIQNAQTASRQAVDQVSSTVANYSENMDGILTLLKQEVFASEQNRDEFMDAFFQIRTDAVAVSIYNEDGSMISCWSKEHMPNPQAAKNLSFDIDAVKNADGFYISGPHVESVFEGWYPWVVTMTIPVDSADAQWLALDFSFNSISTYINNVGIGQRGYCFLINGDGDIIYHPQQQLIYSDLKQENTADLAGLSDGVYFKDKVIYALRTDPHSGWRVVGVSYVQELITSHMDEMRRIVILSALAIFAAAFGSSFLLSRKLSRPLLGLSNAMAAFEEDAEHFTYVPVGGSLEVQNLSDSFGHMVDQIKHLMETVRREEINLRKTELKALQAQINPHFLYNTLDSISWMCEQRRTEDAVKMVNALAKLFRISISHGHELIPIRSELQHAESYLQIQKHRYKDQFTYDIQVDDLCLDFLCNKITLQPIIENALLHGLNGLVDEGHIAISVSRQGSDILMMVQDNGVGMSKEQIATILGKSNSDRTGIGIKNVDERLKIHFGQRYGLEIDSELDVGTTVRILMPQIREENEYEKV